MLVGHFLTKLLLALDDVGKIPTKLRGVMKHRLPLIPPLDPSFAFHNHLSATRTCCAHARQAARSGRMVVAHTLFQSALGFFEQARGVAAPDNEQWLRRALKELDADASLIYSTTASVSELQCGLGGYSI